jgi:hypothetical protein
MKPFAVQTLAQLACLAAACSGCAVPWKSPQGVPGQYQTVRDQLVLFSDFPLATHHRLVEELILRRADLCRHLDLPVSDEPISIYLFGGEQEYSAFMRVRFPTLPPRRAFFVETDTQLTVYAQWGDRISEDLRHEVTHGYLHAVVPNLPLWLDEGLAEYYETPRGRLGLNEQHLEWFRQQGGQWVPNLPRLEQLSPSANMTAADYAEAWAWVHFLLQSQAEHRETLRAYLHDLRQDGQGEPISSRLRCLRGDPNPLLVEHLRRASAVDAASNAGRLAQGAL